jgi:hypothetical protein
MGKNKKNAEKPEITQLINLSPAKDRHSLTVIGKKVEKQTLTGTLCADTLHFA